MKARIKKIVSIKLLVTFRGLDSLNTLKELSTREHNFIPFTLGSHSTNSLDIEMISQSETSNIISHSLDFENKYSNVASLCNTKSQTPQFPLLYLKHVHSTPVPYYWEVGMYLALGVPLEYSRLSNLCLCVPKN